MMLTLYRDGGALHNWGELFVDGKLLGQTLEDKDRGLENGGTKIAGQTAIPRGQYRMGLTPSRRFGRVMPQVFDVPGFEGVRIHGGNTEENTEGCPLLGQVRTLSGVADCHGVNERLMLVLQAAELRGEEVWLEVK